MFGVIDWIRRRRAAREPFSDAWRDILRRRVPFYARFDAAERARFEDKLKVFVLTKHFSGARGMRIDDEVKVTIGAAAARLVMNLPSEHYARLVEVLVYPSHFKHPHLPGAVVLGEAFGPGTVILSWDAVLHGLANDADGLDTATHEFAHALDGAAGAFDGTPELRDLEAYGPWSRVMSAAFARHRGIRSRKQRAVLREYAGKNEAEFFAVATEAFFEKPRQMRAKHPALYGVLSDYYRSDPAGP